MGEAETTSVGRGDRGKHLQDVGMLVRAVLRGLAYVAIVFAIGFVFGVVRQSSGVSGSALVWAEGVEGVVMVVLSFFVCRRVARGLTRALAVRAAMGATALVVLLGLEAAVGLLLRGMSWAEYLRHFATVRGVMSLAAYACFAVMPLVVRGE